MSEIGEQWSPHTAPAIHAAMHTMPMGSSRGKIAMVMGMSTPNVPQLVPVAKASRQPIRNTMAGRNICMPSAPLFTRSRTKYFAPRESVMAFSDHANVRIIMAGTIALKPSGMQPIISRKDIARRSI